jgi:hypothetical protein
MSLISSKKQYDKLISFGCSFTAGGTFTEGGSWGNFLSNKLGCKCEHNGGVGSSNYMIMTHVINYCETHDMTNICVGIQWSQLIRRELFDNKTGYYTTFVASALYDDYNDPNVSLKFFKDNKEYFISLWFDNREMVIRTIHSMIMAQNYLKSKNIDYIMFEGIGSIMDIDFNENDIKVKNLSLLKNENKVKLYNDISFFNELGDMKSYMQKHPDYSNDLNSGHPTTFIQELWGNHLYNYILNKS